MTKRYLMRLTISRHNATARSVSAFKAWCGMRSLLSLGLRDLVKR